MLVALGGFLLACSEPTSPDALLGRYVAVKWETILLGDTTNSLAIGGSYELTLERDSVARGMVVVPNFPDVTFEGEGYWWVHRDTVFFYFDPDLPLAWSIWLVRGDTLFGRGLSGYEAHHLWLVRIRD